MSRRLWVVLTAISTAYVVRYAQRVRADPTRSLTGMDLEEEDTVPAEGVSTSEQLTGVQKAVLVITGLTFALLIFSVIPARCCRARRS